MVDPDDRSTLDVAAILRGSRLVVVGGTGFLGKLFWSMLLDRYPDVGRIFLVVRSKGDGGAPEARFEQEIARSDAFEPLRRAHGPDYEDFLRRKVTPVDGDMGRPLCGVAPALVNELRGTIDAVVNVAGVVDFNPALDDALAANAFGAQNLVDLARALGDAPVLHTSTAYVAGARAGLVLEDDPRRTPFPRAAEIGVELWDPRREIAECLDLIAQANQRADDAFRQSEFAEQARANLAARGEPSQGEAYGRELARVKRAFVRQRLVEAGLDRATHWGWPNIYTYTKAIGEQVIAGSGLAFTIARPAACESSVSYPERGYNEGINTSAPLIYLIMKGEPQILGRHTPLDLIPADFVVAGMILALVELLEGTARPVYHLGAADVNPCTTQRFGELVGLYKRTHYRRRGTGRLLFDALQARYEPSFVGRREFERLGAPAREKVTRAAAQLARAALPRAFEGVARSLDGAAHRDAKIAEIQRLFEPFTSTLIGPFDCSNARAAYARLSEGDKRRLPWAPETIDWADWMLTVHMPAMEKRIIPEMDQRLKKELKPLAPHTTLASLVDEMAERHGMAVALQKVTDEGLSRITFADVRRGADAAAARVAARGLGKGDRVVLSGENDPDWAIAYLGIVRSGATVVPVAPSLAASEWSRVLAESAARLIVWDTSVDAGVAVGAAHPDLAAIDLHELVEPSEEPDAPEVDVEPDDVASLVFTSGTAGRSKAVALTHANFTSLTASLAPVFPLRAGDAVLSVLPLHHTFEFTCGLLLPFSRGARVVYLGDRNGVGWSEALRVSRATAVVGVPALWQGLERRILQRVDARGPGARALFDAALEVNRWLSSHTGLDAGRLLFGEVHGELGSSARWLVSGGVALPRETQEHLAGLGLRVLQGYGLTEAAPVLAVTRPGRGAERGLRALPGIELKIDRPDGAGLGEILARGPDVMLGYADREGARAGIDPDGWLHTGDLGRLHARGRLEVVGRIDNAVASPGGERVYPEVIEARLGGIRHVLEVVVVSLALRETVRLACLAVPEADAGTDRADRNERVRAALRRAIDDLPAGQRPTIVHLYDGPLPRMPTQEINRDEVRAIASRLVAATSRGEGASSPSIAVRFAIAALCGVERDAIGPTTSLRADLRFEGAIWTELLEALEVRFGAVDPRLLRRSTTVRDVERLAETRAAEGAGAATAGRAPHEVPGRVLPEPARVVGKRIVGKLQDLFYGDIMKPRVHGRSYIPHNRNVIVVANHASHLDMGLVRHALGHYGHGIVSLAAQDYFFESGLKRAFFENLTNLKAIDRRASLRQSIRQASAVIEQGKTVLIFPEGTRSETGEMRDFKPLVGHLALVHGVDILPICLGGTHAAMPKGAALPMRRDLLVRIGPPLRVEDLRRLTAGLAPAGAAREVTHLAQAAVAALRDGRVLDLAREGDGVPAPVLEHPLVKLFSELESKFRAGEVERPVSYYVTLGHDELAKWTVRVDARACDVRPGKPEGGQADCVLKTTPEIFAKIVREAYVPSPADFLSGAVKSNDVSLLMTFQKVFQLDQAS